MGIRFFCPRGHKLNVKAELAGKMGICPKCGERMLIPLVSTREHGERKASDEDNRSVKSMTIAPDSLQSDKIGEMDNVSRFTEIVREEDDLSVVQMDVVAQTHDIDDTADISLAVPDSHLTSFNLNSDQPLAPASSGPVSSLDKSSAPLSLDSLSTQSGTLASDSLLADPTVVWYVRAGDNQTYGPATSQVIKSWVQEKRIGPTMLVWREGWSTWMEARNVFPELESIFISPSVTSSPVPPASPQNSSSNQNPLVQTEDYSDSIAEQKKIEKKKKASRDLAIVIVLVVLIIILATTLCIILFSKDKTGNETKKETPAQPQASSIQYMENLTNFPSVHRLV